MRLAVGFQRPASGAKHVQKMTVESQPFRPTPTSTNKCGSNCGYAIFNNNGTGYKATALQCTAKISLASGDVPNSNYSLMWRLSGTSFDCSQDASDGVSKQFDAALGKIYVLTAYFKPGFAPQNGESVTISVDWQ